MKIFWLILIMKNILFCYIHIYIAQKRNISLEDYFQISKLLSNSEISSMWTSHWREVAVQYVTRNQKTLICTYLYSNYS